MTDKGLLDKARANLETMARHDLRALPPLGRRWAAFALWTKKHVSQFSTVEEAIHFAQMQHGFELREMTVALQHSIPQYQSKIRGEFPHFAQYLSLFGESTLSHPSTVIEYDGRPLSSMLCHLVRFLFVCTHYAKYPRRICEIGGGYGALARLAVKNPIYNIDAYAIIDLAESLYFAEVFLRTELGIDNVHYVRHPNEKLRANNLPKVILCPLQCIDALKDLKWDLVINTLSMQEMSEEWIDFYMNWLDESDAPLFYSFNAFGRPIDKLYENMNTFSPRLSRNWVVKLKRFPYDEFTAEIIAERTNPDDARVLQAHMDLFRLMEGRCLDGNCYLDIIDSIRYTGDRRMTLDAIERVMSELPYIPKEMFYFLKFLRNEAGGEFYSQFRAKIDGYFAVVCQERQKGQEGTTIPVLEKELAGGT